jgi:hypothetical protein
MSSMAAIVAAAATFAAVSTLRRPRAAGQAAALGYE